MEDWQNGGFGLYIHWPFCQSKCPYCDFNSHVAATIDQSDWERAYLSEIERVSRETSGRVLNTVFFGGGTPSLMDPELVNSILSKVRDCWTLSNDVEITLEANPTSVESGRFQGYRDAGVNRISMGIQSLKDEDLKRLGRLHSVAEAQKAFDIARSTFDRVSFDLIYARQGQTIDAWRSELREALSMAIDHLSLYQLTIEQGTAFGDRYNRGQLRDLPSDDSAADMYFVTQDECEKAGMPAYEVSNHAREGSESRHNLIYWRYGDYVGIGPGAHGRLTLDGKKYAIDTPLAPTSWLQSVTEKGHGENPREVLSGYDQAVEYLMMGLRITEGIDLNRLSSLLGNEFTFKNKYLIEDGFISTESGRLSITGKGRPVLNAIIRELIPDN
ncbi:radical SAM family heme chaperone HemW [Celeribacter halophilus]|uniref:radical SAM family heme chaperone HemW n=1 Tax=Celeribacter halophilus TaxID=576117 RepID=UPI001C0A1EE9|nr:radical SAM family heme chaperone HemW [Celeribacter halophilus]MBU2889678.1 radical SAM family heme chaperone HemW [Celeribacter halophilus]MDO6510679.1 radical SAM family heme chaperone HemW [Celeribacter halophilus]